MSDESCRGREVLNGREYDGRPELPGSAYGNGSPVSHGDCPVAARQHQLRWPSMSGAARVGQPEEWLRD